MDQLFAPLLAAEVAAARIEARLEVDERLAKLWRNEAALIEAVNSTGMEDIRIGEIDLLSRIAVNGVTHEEPRGVEQALDLLRILRQPGDLHREPLSALRRIEQAAAPVGSAQDFSDRPGDEELGKAWSAAQAWKTMPVAAGLRASAEYAWASGRHAPAAERLVFMAVEGALRGGNHYGRSHEGDPDHLLMSARLSAQWICTPATAMVRAGLMIWSPLNPAKIRQFILSLARCLEADLGALGPLRHQIQRMDALAQGRRGQSRHKDFVDLLPEHPVFNSGLVMDRLGVTRATALALIAEFEAEGLVALLTPRRNARFWATRSIASRLTLQPSSLTARAGGRRHLARDHVSQSAPDRSDLGGVYEEAPPSSRDQDRESMERAMAEFDRALAAADAILAGIDAGRMKNVE